MRKIIYLLIFVPVFSIAQISEKLTGFEYSKAINEISTADDARLIADEIMSSGKRKFVPYAKYEEENTTEQYLVFYYYPDTFTKEQMKADFDKFSNWCEQCRRVTFRIFYKGKNANLEIPGIKTYAFKEVEGKYLDLFPWWQKRFYPDSTPEQVLDDNDLRRIGSGSQNQLMKFEKTSDDNWRIVDFY